MRPVKASASQERAITHNPYAEKRDRRAGVQALNHTLFRYHTKEASECLVVPPTDMPIAEGVDEDDGSRCAVLLARDDGRRRTMQKLIANGTRRFRCKAEHTHEEAETRPLAL